MLDGIKGESQDRFFKDGIDIMSASFGASNTSKIGSAGKASYSDLSLMKLIDSASLPLLKSLAQGKHLTEGTLYFFNGNISGKPYLTIRMRDIIVTSQQLSASGNDKITEGYFLELRASFVYVFHYG